MLFGGPIYEAFLPRFTPPRSLRHPAFRALDGDEPNPIQDLAGRRPRVLRAASERLVHFSPFIRHEHSGGEGGETTGLVPVERKRSVEPRRTVGRILRAVACDAQNSSVPFREPSLHRRERSSVRLAGFAGSPVEEHDHEGAPAQAKRPRLLPSPSRQRHPRQQGTRVKGKISHRI
jgi:hypothetical protein